MKYVLGAYATSPSTLAWDPQLETRYYHKLKELDNISTIEHPFVGSLHPFDDSWFLNNIDPEWDFIFTSIPGVMKALSTDKEFGIASDCEAGQKAALDFYWQVRQAVVKLNTHLQRQAVKFVKIHTSPNRLKAISSSVSALQKALILMQSWDWDGAELVVEHCDAYIEGQIPEKGFLSIDEEIAAITATNHISNSNIGISINWGRSALEMKNVQGPLVHIKKAKAANLLRGLIFSGASAVETPYGIWKDTHMPPAQAFGISAYAEHSFMTAGEIKKCLKASEYLNLDFLGIKISVNPNKISVEQRIAYNKDALRVLDRLTSKRSNDDEK